MDTHKNAPLTPKGREAMVRSVIEGGLNKAVAARQFNTTAKTVAKWVGRFRAEDVDGLRDRSSRPLSLPSQTPPAKCAAVEVLRRQRQTGKQIAAEVGVSPVYLTQVFQQVEGLPLYRYQLHLRLARALDRLGEDIDLTRLALDLGFSSQSHFGAAFKRAYGQSPLQFRRATKGR